MPTGRPQSTLLLSLAVVLLGSAPLAAEAPSAPTEVMQRLLADSLPAEERAPEHFTPCEGGMAGGYPCDAVDLLEFLPLSAIGGGNANDLWGWTDPLTGKEYAIVGRTTGTAFVDLTDPEAAVYLGNLPSHTGSSVWRDIKVYADHALVVSDFNGAHGMQVFDLTRLRSVASPPVSFTEDAWYDQIGSAHNIVVDEATGFAYIVGGSSAGAGTTCSGGLHMVNVQNPVAPTFAGCFSADGYTHDAQCVLYDGPDADYAGHEICVASNEDTVTIVDVTNKAAPVQISRTPYPGNGYTHQAWLTESREHLLVDDELDEQSFGHNTRTYVWDLRDLDAPELLGHFQSPTPAIDHNQYVRGDYVFQANYRSGLRILHLGDLDAAAGPELAQVGYFDVYPTSDSANFNGAWSVYPYFESGIVIVSGIEQGLFVLQPRLCSDPLAPGSLAATPNGDGRIDLEWSGSGAPGATFTLERAQGGCGGTFAPVATGLADETFADTSVSGAVTYGYRVTELDPTGLCASPPSTCVEAETTGACLAPPIFAGLDVAATPGAPFCAVRLVWSAGAAACGGPVSYDVHRSTDPQFVPAAENRIATGVAATFFDDFSAAPGTLYAYAVRAVDLANGAADANLVRRQAAALGPVADGTFATGAEVGDPPLDTSGDPFAAPPAPESPAAPEAPEHIGWHFSAVRARDGERSFFSTYANSLCVSLVAGPLALTPGESPALSFWTLHDIENQWDGGSVEVRPAGGSWTQLALAPAYPGAFNGGSDACGYATGTPSFTGSDLVWGEHGASLAPWAGQSVEIRWNFSTDGSETAEGWYVDDIAITHAQVPAACAPDSGLFADDFESGGAAAWDDAQGLLP